MKHPALRRTAMAGTMGKTVTRILKCSHSPMPEPILRPDNLVLYKSRPGRIVAVGDKKIDVQAESGETVSVRPKDIVLLHPGPLRSLADLQPPTGEVTAAWELLAG